MNVKIFLYLFVIFMFTTSNIFAKDTDFTTSILFVGMSMDYREYDRNGQILDSEESEYIDITGVDMSLGYIFAKDMSSYSTLKLGFMIVGGETVYKGSDLDSGEPFGSRVSTTQNTIIDTEISYKYTNLLKNNFELSYGLGIAYREWERALSASQVEVYKWYSIRPSIGASVLLKEKVNLGLFLEYQYGLDTVMTYSDPNLDLKFRLGGADIWELSLPISYKYSEKIDFLFEATFQKQTIKASDVKSGYYEPDSTAYNNYLKLGVEFKF